MTKPFLFAAFLSACSIPGVSLVGHTSVGPTAPAQVASPPPERKVPPHVAVTTTAESRSEIASSVTTTPAATSSASAPAASEDPARATLEREREKYVEIDRQTEADQQARVDELGKAGLKGDRLTLALTSGYRGGSNTRMTLQQLRTAKYVFVLSGTYDDGYILHRYELAGDRIVDQRDEGFVVMPGPSAYR